jgi:acyl carrier protein
VGDKSEFEGEVRSVVEKLAQRSVRVNSLLFERNYLDSLKVLHLVSFLESKLGARIPDELITLDNFRSVQAITNAFWNYSR